MSNQGRDDLIAEFASITAASPAKAETYLRVSDWDLANAIQLFFESGGVDLDIPASSAPPLPARGTGTSDAPISVDEDDDVREALNASAAGHNVDDDEAYARKLQEELYGSGGGGAGSSGGAGGDEVRAPIPRTRETLVGGYEDEDEAAYYPPAIPRVSRRPVGIFNQRTPSTWADPEDPNISDDERRRRLAEATDGASERSAQHRGLAEMYRPPFEIISHLPFDEARDEAKEEEKWILVNIQEASYFQSQTLNRDIWKDRAVMETIKENFLFLQMDRSGRDGRDYIRLYLPQAAAPGLTANDPIINELFPHIAIIDPRTGEQVKAWTSLPTDPVEFLHQLHEFLDRYSLRADAKNPVARTSRPKVDVEHMTEDQMLEMALQASLGENSGTPTHEDPDNHTRGGDDAMEVDEPKGKEPAQETPFSRIASDRHHSEPPNGPDTTRIQFKLHDGSRVVRRFLLKDKVERLFEYVKADLLPEQAAKKGDDSDVGKEFDLVTLGKKLIDMLDETVEEAGLKMATIMVEVVEEE